MSKFCNGGFVIWPYMFSSKPLCPFLPYSHTLRSNANSSGSQVSPANLQSGLQPTSAMVSWAQMMHQPSWSQMCWQTCWHHWVPSDCMSIWKAALYMWSCGSDIWTALANYCQDLSTQYVLGLKQQMKANTSFCQHMSKNKVYLILFSSRHPYQSTMWNDLNTLKTVDLRYAPAT